MRFVSVLQLLFLLADGKRAKRGRVKGGSKVRDSTKYPSFVSIVTRNGLHYCGGVILDETTVLSSAHCQIEKGHKVAYGTIKRSDKIDSSIKYADVKSVNNIGKMIQGGFQLWDQDYR
jgi:secreted trypsin-like serine protease